MNDPTQIVNYLKSLPPGAIDGQQEMAAISLANNTMTQAHKQLDINQGQAEAAAVAYQQKYVAANGHPDMARLIADRESLVIGDKTFANIAGRAYETPTLPSVQSTVENRIKNLSSINDAETLLADIHAGALNKEINGGDAFRYESTVRQQIRQMKTPAGQANIQALGQLKAFYMPVSREDGRLATKISGANPFAQAAAKAEMTYRALVYGHPGEPPQFYIDAMQKAEKASPRPGSETKPPTTPAALPPKVPDALAAEYARERKLHPEWGRKCQVHA